MKYALDTNTLIYFFKGQGNVAENLLATAPADIQVPAVVVYELQTGIAKSSEPDKRQQQLAELLDVVTVLPFDRTTAEHAARIRAHLEQQGTPIGPMDTLIAATALANSVTLVTHNVTEFQRVPDLPLADWFT
ncbi:PilT protein domain protein [Thioalkalivibrio sp. K90mix]|uniref:type II toxin-antitoxin system VapC family toxin n=1 Tax=Thioalkalivibrio sp. (strain K90mix) TaxID=396595 RepID=UPI000195A667|nr:type II toxin-antitoxin system VapC family toxin [Thioalkalivibrio sp. K90mix]ADC72036.1 PilT protein domain protein [Thioalkalivibrio sp. K90mix]